MAQKVTIPQIDAPFRLDANGHIAVVQQDSQQDVGACLYNAVICPQGAKLNDPSFGIPLILFGTMPLDLSGVIAALQALDTRFSSLTAQQVLDALNDAETVTLTVQA